MRRGDGRLVPIKKRLGDGVELFRGQVPDIFRDGELAAGMRRGRGRDLGRVAGFTFVADTGFDEPQGGVIKPLNKAGYFFLHGISSVPISDFSGYAGYPTG